MDANTGLCGSGRGRRRGRRQRAVRPGRMQGSGSTPLGLDRTVRLRRGGEGNEPPMSHDPIELLVEHGDEHGCVNMTELYEVINKLELEEEDTEAVLERLHERGIEV